MDKVLRATSVAIIIFATVIAFVVGSRIDQNTISLLSGTVIGILIAAPCATIITFVLVRRRESNNSLSSYDRGIRHSTPLPQNPPQYWVLPQQFAAMNAPAYMQAAGASNTGAPMWQVSPDQAAYAPRPRRRFYVIGENGEPRLLESPAAPDSVTSQYELDGDDAGGVF
jgi:hypothetical protein